MSNKFNADHKSNLEGNPPEVRSRYRLKNKTTTAAQVLSRLLNRSGLKQKLEKYQFVQFWPQIVGKSISAKAKPEALRNGILIVRVENSAWAQELSFQKTVIRNRLNAFLGAENSVKDIHFYVSSDDQLAARRGKSS
jgi:predicted nucleic acid-binding Zn ribbon protein